VNELTDPIQSWMASGRFTRQDGVELFYRVSGQSQRHLPWLVCFHGFPTSSWDWHELLPYLKQTHRVLIFDFPGYGLSEKLPERDYSLSRQLDAAEALFRFLGIEAFDLLAHDMGNSVACELLRRREQGKCGFVLNSLTLLNGGIYMDLHQPLLTQRLLRTPFVGAVTARLSSWAVFRRQYPAVYAEPEQFDELHYRSQWALLQHNQGRRTLHKVAGYMKERQRMGDKWTGPLHRLDLPLKVIWGRRDPIAVYAIAEKLCRENPRTGLHTLDEIGHYPQLEAPAEVARILVSRDGPSV
jgi:pimeloyl-ACP methyl ester carboxylesterase